MTLARPSLYALAVLSTLAFSRQQAADDALLRVRVVDSTTAFGLSGATVTLSGPSAGSDRVGLSDRGGWVEFDGLRPGELQVIASKTGFLAAGPFARRPGRRGAVLDVKVGPLSVTLALAPAGAISGTVFGPGGTPVQEASVFALRRASVRPGSVTVPARNLIEAKTNDVGMYRLAGLEPGNYLVIAVMRPRPSLGIEGYALGKDGRRSSMEGALTYYPDSADPEHAADVIIGTGDDRSDVNLRLRAEPVTRLDGYLVAPGNQDSLGRCVLSVIPVAEPQPLRSVLGVRTVRSDPGGKFVVDGLRPGTYLVAARSDSVVGVGPDGTGPVRSGLWGAARLVVLGAPAESLDVVMQSGGTVAGRLAVSGGGANPSLPRSGTAVRLSLASTDGQGTPPLASVIGPDGQFIFTAVPHGKYRLSAAGANSPTNRAWFVESATVDGRDVLDTPFEVTGDGGTQSVLVTMTDRPTVLSGTLQPAPGSLPTESYVVVFPVERELRRHDSLRMPAPTQPSTAGHFRIAGLPPGSYYVGVVMDYDDDTWFDQDWLDAVSRSAMMIRLSAGERASIDVAGGVR